MPLTRVQCQRMVRILLAGFLAVALAAPALADWRAERARGDDHYFNLEYDEAIAAYQRAIDEQPAEASLYNHLANTILYQELHRLGLLETSAFKGDNQFLGQEKPQPDPETGARFLEVLGKARSLAEERLEKDERDTAALLSLSLNHGLEANYQFMIEKSYFAALKNGSRARKYSDQLMKVDPALVDPYLVAGVQEYVIGSLPWAVKMLVAIGGIRGSKEKGQEYVSRVAEEGERLRNEARVLLTLLYRREGRPLQAAKVLEGLIDEFPRNYVLRLELGSMYADAEQPRKALEVFQNAQRMVHADEQRYGRMPERLRKALDRKVQTLLEHERAELDQLSPRG